MGFFDREPLSRPRLRYAFVLGPVAGALFVPALMLGYALLTGPRDGDVGSAVAFGLFALVFSVPSTLLIGLPAFSTLRRHLEPRPIWFVVVGMLAALVPVTAIVAAPFLFSLTAGPIMSVLSILGLIALSGALGGWTFWLIAAWRPTRREQAS